jgi:hypothetical protein
MFRRNVMHPSSGQNNKPSKHTECESANREHYGPIVRCCETSVSFYQYRRLRTLHSYRLDEHRISSLDFNCLKALTLDCTLLRHRRQIYSRVGRVGRKEEGSRCNWFRNMRCSIVSRPSHFWFPFFIHEDTSWALWYWCDCQGRV